VQITIEHHAQTLAGFIIGQAHINQDEILYFKRLKSGEQKYKFFIEKSTSIILT